MLLFLSDTPLRCIYETRLLPVSDSPSSALPKPLIIYHRDYTISCLLPLHRTFSDLQDTLPPYGEAAGTGPFHDLPVGIEIILPTASSLDLISHRGRRAP
jgi:hypothetical protein